MRIACQTCQFTLDKKYAYKGKYCSEECYNEDNKENYKLKELEKWIMIKEKEDYVDKDNCPYCHGYRFCQDLKEKINELKSKEG